MSAALAGIAACWYFWSPPVLVVVTLLFLDRRRGRVTTSDRCVCIHPQRMHEHWRPGTDCGKCDCPEFVPAVELVRARQMPGTMDRHLVTLEPETRSDDEFMADLRDLMRGGS